MSSKSRSACLVIGPEDLVPLIQTADSGWKFPEGIQKKDVQHSTVAARAVKNTTGQTVKRPQFLNHQFVDGCLLTLFVATVDTFVNLRETDVNGRQIELFKVGALEDLDLYPTHRELLTDWYRQSLMDRQKQVA